MTYRPEEEQKSFSPQKFRDNIEYAKKVGFPEVYLWGAEWWFYKKNKEATNDIGMLQRVFLPENENRLSVVHLVFLTIVRYTIF